MEEQEKVPPEFVAELQELARSFREVRARRLAEAQPVTPQGEATR